MTKASERGFAPSVADVEFEQLWVWWAREYGLDLTSAKWLALYQYTGGNAFRLIDLDGRTNFAERGQS